jgi:hypothetical protein
MGTSCAEASGVVIDNPGAAVNSKAIAKQLIFAREFAFIGFPFIHGS